MAKSTTAGAGTGKAVATGRKRGLLRSFVRYLQESWYELLKVNWPTWHEVTRFTGVVLLTIGVVALLIAGLDWLFGHMSQIIFKL